MGTLEYDRPRAPAVHPYLQRRFEPHLANELGLVHGGQRVEPVPIEIARVGFRVDRQVRDAERDQVLKEWLPCDGSGAKCSSVVSMIARAAEI